MAGTQSSSFLDGILAGKWESSIHTQSQQFRSFASSLILDRRMGLCSHSLSSLRFLITLNCMLIGWAIPDDISSGVVGITALPPLSVALAYIWWCQEFSLSAWKPHCPTANGPGWAQWMISEWPVLSPGNLGQGLKSPSPKCLQLAFHQPHLQSSILNCLWHLQTTSQHLAPTVNCLILSTGDIIVTQVKLIFPPKKTSSIFCGT